MKNSVVNASILSLSLSVKSSGLLCCATPAETFTAADGSSGGLGLFHSCIHTYTGRVIYSDLFQVIIVLRLEIWNQKLFHACLAAYYD